MIAVVDYRKFPYKYRYSKTGEQQLMFSNNISALTVSETGYNGIQQQATYIKLNDSVKILGEKCFANLINVKQFICNNTLEEIGDFSFENCMNISEFMWPASVKTINDYAFARCSRLGVCGFAGYENDIPGITYELDKIGEGFLSGCVNCKAITIPNTVNALNKINSKSLAGAAVEQITFLGLNDSNITELTSSSCLGIGHDCIIYTGARTKFQYSASTNSITKYAGWNIFDGTKIKTGKPDKLALGKHIYHFESRLFEWCVDPSKQDPVKFPNARTCPVVTIFCDFTTSSKSQLFLENVLKNETLYQWLKANGRWYTFVLSRDDVSKSADTDYFRRKIPNYAHDFVSVNFTYNGQTYSTAFTPGSVQDFIDTLIDGANKAKFSDFDTDGYISMLDVPDPEQFATKSVNTSALAGWVGSTPKWWDGSKIKSQTIWNITDMPMDYDFISTPETTYIVFASYDMDSTKAPAAVKTKLYPLFKSYSDHVFFYDQNEIGTSGKHFQKGLSQGANYRFLIFYEFSHGSDGSVSIDGGFSNRQTWDILKNFTNRQRVFGIWDSCHSGSMLNYANSQSNMSASTTDEAPADYLIKKFERRQQLMRAIFKTDAPAPKILMWSSTTASTYGWYNKEISTILQTAICKAYSNNIRYSKIWPNVVKNGTREYKDVFYKGDSGTTIPQQKTYNISGTQFVNNMTFT